MSPLTLFVCVLLDVLSFGKTIQYTEPILTFSGSLRGEEVEVEGIKFKAFKGIPYASPPVAEYRFNDPQPPPVWDDIKDVVTFGYICHQGVSTNNITSAKEEELKKYVGSQDEDCLNLNVYSKKLGQEAQQPVVFFIHGDGFFFGDGTDANYGPEFLVDQGLVVVTCNYRLGPLGFLATDTEDAPGNWGLKDQVAALKWVNENIAEFGGDPDQVTIYGQGSGASCAHFHLLSPLSEGLFDKVVLSSGTANSAQAVTFEQNRFSENLAKYLGASEEQAGDPAKRVEFLRSVDATKLSVSMWNALEAEDIENNLGLPIPFAPVLEPLETQNYFMTEELISQSLSKGKFYKVPMMIGFDSNEGGFDMVLPRFRSKSALKKLNEDLCLAIPQPLREVIQDTGECGKVADEIRRVYFAGKSIIDQEENLTNLVSDSIYITEIDYAKNLHAKYSKEGHFVYNYYFTYDGEWNLMKDALQNTIPFAVPGAVHGDELFYIFNPRVKKLPLRKPSKAGLDTKARMISFISNFVKTGNPTPDVSDLVPILWEPAQEGKINTMVIDADIKMEQGVLKKRKQFWEDIYERYDLLSDKEKS